MSYKGVRKGNTQAEFNESASNWLYAEIFIISVAAGVLTLSWLVFGLILFSMIGMMFFKRTAKVLAFTLTFFCGIIAFMIGLALFGPIAGVVIGVIALLVTGGLHLGALEWTDDMIGRSEDHRNHDA